MTLLIVHWMCFYVAIMLGFRDATVMGDEGMASMICIEHSPQFDAALPFLVNVTGGNASSECAVCVCVCV